MSQAPDGWGIQEKQQALIALRRLQARVDTLERSRREPIAVVGMSCRFPGGADTPEAFWRLLREGRCAVAEVPRSRWNADDISGVGQPLSSTRYGSFLEDVDCFDPAFFGISGREASSMDPQQRLLLEIVWQALENAGATTEHLHGSRTGVFTGICFNDYARRHFFSGDPGRIDAWSGTGIADSVASGRISYLLGLRGPNLPVDTACSSSLVAVHLACQSLRLQESDMAVVAGVNLMLSPEASIYFTKVGALAPDGISKTFDASADGYGRGEGCAAIVLKRLSDAQQSHDRILALIRGSAVNHDGRSAGLTVPNGVAQKEVIEAALADAAVAPGRIGYVEAHGTGTPLGDPIEVMALHEALVSGKERQSPLTIGSVKTNIGHLEAVAGLAGLIKAILCLQHAQIPAHLHLRNLNPEIVRHAAGIEFPLERTVWSSTSQPRMAAVSAFGFSGTNAHVILEESAGPELSGGVEDQHSVLALSAKTEAALERLRLAYADFLEQSPPASWKNICATAALRRIHFPHRTAVVAASAREASNLLRRLPTGPSEESSLVPPSIVSAARRYQQGEKIDWQAMFDASAPPLALPNYQFERGSYWIDPDPPVAVNEEGRKLHPLLGRRLASPLASIQFEVQLCANAPEWLNDHRVFGSPVFPATGYVEMAMRAAAELATDVSSDLAVVDVALQQPLHLPTRGESFVTVQVLVEGDTFRILSLKPRSQTEWTLHCVGRLVSKSALRRDAGEVQPWARKPEARRITHEEIYAELHGRGLEYGPAFRCIQELWYQNNEVLARIDARSAPSDLRVPPSVLDACLQALYWAMPGIDKRACYVPVGFKSIESFSHVQQELWCRGIVNDDGTADILLSAGDGMPVLAVASAQFRPIDAGWSQETQSENLATKSLRVVWWERDVEERSPPAPPTKWLLFGASDWAIQELSAQLRERGICITVAGSMERDVDAARTAGEAWGCIYAALTDPSAPSLTSLSGEEVLQRQRVALGGLISLTQHLAIAPIGVAWRGLCVVTAGAQRVGDDERVQDPEAASLWAMVRSINTEHRDIAARAVDLDRQRLSGSIDQLASELQQSGAGLGIEEVAFRGSRRFVMRLVSHTTPKGTGPLRLEMGSTRGPESLRLTNFKRAPPAEGQIEIEIAAAGLNFRDVMAVLGIYPGEVVAPGAECAGTVAGVGPGIDEFSVGDRVVALGGGCFATHAALPAALAVRLPQGMSFEDAAGIPVAFLTASFALFDIAQLKKGERVLIHAAAGGVGLAAVQLALARGAELFVTAGNEEKRSLLRSLGAHHVMNSRSLDFEQEINAITRGEGVDVVLNSLAADYVVASLRAMRSGGRFVEIGKTALLQSHEAAALKPDGAYTVFDLASLAAEKPVEVRSRLASLLQDFELERLRLSPSSKYPINDAASAFRLMSQGKHVGKIVLTNTHSHAFTISKDATCLITGGLGAVGVAIARHSITWGARNIVLLGRRKPDAKAAEVVRELRDQGVRVEILSADVADESQLAAALASVKRSLPPVRIVIHAAGALKDQPLHTLTWRECEEVLAPKIAGAWNLLRLLRDQPVEHFVWMSSMASVLAPPGQGAYAAANEFMDALSESAGPSILSVGWGPWQQTGMASKGAADRARQFGIVPLTTESALSHLDAMLAHARRGRVVILPIEESSFSRIYDGLGRPGRLSELFAGQMNGSIVSGLRGLSPPEALQKLRDYLARSAAAILEIAPDGIDPHRPLQELGLDSMMAVELRGQIYSATGCDCPASLLFDYPTIERLAAHLGDLLLDVRPSVPIDRADDLDNLSEAQLATLLAGELDAVSRSISR